MRIIISLFLSITAMFFTIMAVSTPFLLRAQAADDRVYYRKFSEVAAAIERNQQLPADQVLRIIQTGRTYPVIELVQTIPSDCEPNLKKAASDHLILTFWRGECFECYLSPSGRSTLEMSVKAYLLSGLGINLVGYLLLAGASMWIATRVWRGANLAA